MFTISLAGVAPKKSNDQWNEGACRLFCGAPNLIEAFGYWLRSRRSRDTYCKGSVDSTRPICGDDLVTDLRVLGTHFALLAGHNRTSVRNGETGSWNEQRLYQLALRF